ncbi:hypothetical protein D9758_004934 [Tetrapyrgos nigripes]|uniref:Uncharacterized protein n=1 Tax=Tetrapyrgos nigripes TaxID=182062 RepID=A0A8H5GW15_9AGAR|nr:hypothetical protein D9758_004934 [Tetrapyrgos nigripes]
MCSGLSLLLVPRAGTLLSFFHPSPVATFSFMPDAISFDDLKANPKIATPRTLENLANAAGACEDAFFQAIPIYMNYLPARLPLHPGNRSQINHVLTSHILARNSLSGIATGAKQDKLVSTDIQELLRQYWPRMWAWISFFIRSYVKTLVCNGEVAQFRDSFLSLASSLIYSLAFPGRIVDNLIRSPGIISFVVDQFFRNVQAHSFDAQATKNWYLTIRSLSRSIHWHTYGSIVKDAFDEVDPKFYSTVIERIVSVSQSPANITKLNSVVGTLTLVFTYAPRNQRVLRGTLEPVILVFRKAVTAADSGASEDTVFCLWECLSFLRAAVRSRGHVVLVDALENRLLPFLVRAMLLLSGGCSGPGYINVWVGAVCVTQKTYEDILEAIGAQSTSLAILKVLVKSLGTIKQKGYDEGYPEPFKAKRDVFKSVVEDRIAYRDLWRQAGTIMVGAINHRIVWGIPLLPASIGVRGVNTPISVARNVRNPAGGAIGWSVREYIENELVKGRMSPLDALDIDYRRFLVVDTIRRYQEDTVSEDQAYRSANPSYPTDKPLIHVHYYDRIPFRREVMSMDDVLKLLRDGSSFGNIFILKGNLCT